MKLDEQQTIKLFITGLFAGFWISALTPHKLVFHGLFKLSMVIVEAILIVHLINTTSNVLGVKLKNISFKNLKFILGAIFLFPPLHLLLFIILRQINLFAYSVLDVFLRSSVLILLFEKLINEIMVKDE